MVVSKSVNEIPASNQLWEVVLQNHPVMHFSVRTLETKIANPSLKSKSTFPRNCQGLNKYCPGPDIPLSPQKCIIENSLALSLTRMSCPVRTLAHGCWTATRCAGVHSGTGRTSAGSGVIRLFLAYPLNLRLSTLPLFVYLC